MESKQTRDSRPGRAKGGVARAQKLSPAKRSAIARRAAQSRWQQLPQAICDSTDKPLQIGDVDIPCYVLEDGTRVLSQGGFLEALGRHPKANVLRYQGEEKIPSILLAASLRPFITKELLKKSKPVIFLTPTGHRASGYRAELLPEVCGVYLDARREGTLAYQQEHIAEQAEIVLRALSTVGIIALVDEATGYQEVRAKDALARILEAFIAKELQAWISTFPEDFYRQLFRLRGLAYPEGQVKRPQYFGLLTTDVIYKRLAPGVLNELKRVTPRTDDGRLKHKYFQRLTTNVGYPKLREHLGSVVTLMKLSDDWGDFRTKLDQIHPRVGDTLALPFDYDLTIDDGTGL